MPPPIHDVGDAIREQKAGSKHIRTRAQAIAVGLKAERRAGRRTGRRKTRKALGGTKGFGGGRY